MKLQSALIPFAILFFAATAIGDDKKDAEKIQGEWKLESAVENGKPAKKGEGSIFTITADKITIKDPAEKKEETAAYKLDSNAKPGHIEITPSQDKKTVKGIYELDGDTLKICFTDGGERPKEFTSKEGSKTILLTLKRQKK